jgi:hypothetical protein
MTPSERTLAIGTRIGVVVFIAYWVIVGVRAATDGLPLDDVAWEGPLLLCIGLGAALYAVTAVTSRIAGRHDRAMDQRDRDIARLGGARDAELTGLAVLVTLILLALKVDTFWAANVLFTGAYLGSLSSATAQLAAYRHGIPNE